MRCFDTTKATVTRWATSATASSSYSGLPAGVATGAPNAPGCGGSNSWVAAWESSTDGRQETLDLTYANAERARAVKIRETMLERFVMRVDLLEEDGTAHTVYTGGDATKCGDWLTVHFPLTAYKAKKVRVYTRAAGNEGIDAVGLDVQPADAYAYNGFNQLLSVTGTDGTSTTFGYDRNRKQVTKTDASGLTQYAYNQDNRLPLGSRCRTGARTRSSTTRTGFGRRRRTPRGRPATCSMG